MEMSTLKSLILQGAVLFVLAAAFAGCTCVVHSTHTDYARPSPVFAKSAPPAAQAESQPQSPGDGYVWIKGYWEWNVTTETWIWIEGTWEQKPEDGVAWTEPTYEDNNGDWMFTPGYWKKLNRSTDDDGKNVSELPRQDLHATPGAGAEERPRQDLHATPGADAEERPRQDLHVAPGAGAEERPRQGLPTAPGAGAEERPRQDLPTASLPGEASRPESAAEASVPGGKPGAPGHVAPLEPGPGQRGGFKGPSIEQPKPVVDKAHADVEAEKPSVKAELSDPQPAKKEVGKKKNKGKALEKEDVGAIDAAKTHVKKVEKGEAVQ